MNDKTSPVAADDAWTPWRRSTPARIGLGRVGDAAPTAELLRFGWAHASARDAIHARPDLDALEDALAAQGWNPQRVKSRAPDRTTYLRRPDLGRVLDEDDATRLRPVPGGCDVCIVVGDGLSALAIERHAAPLLAALGPLLPPGLRFGPLAIASQARVALADDIGERLGARLSVMLIGERPGLSSPDSLGIYLTFDPRRGRTDAQRNCISNVRAEGLAPTAAAARLAWLMRESLARGFSGVALKDESDNAALAPAPAAPLPDDSNKEPSS
ncbi:MAG: ethanolamine ammonia-lyase subunit EutC [Proteobacteria bacterium]|nr:ethanolamine ammonia-lyase subunit EutC [Pseudomonadota bacterium]